MAEAKHSRRLVLRKENNSSLTFNKITSSDKKSKRLMRENEDNGNDKMSTSHKDALKYRGRSEFSHEDDLAIIHFLLKSGRYMKADRREIWLKMSSQKVTKQSWLKMKERFKQVIQPVIDKYPISEKDANKLRSSPSEDTRKRSLKYQLRSVSPDRNGIPVTEIFRKRSDDDDDDHSWSRIKRRCRSDGQCNSPEKARNLTFSGSSTDDLVAGVALKALPKYKRMKASNLQLNVIKLGNKKRDIKRKTVLKQPVEIYKKSEEVSDAGQNATKLDDLRLRVALLSDTVSSNESTEEQLKTQEKENSGKCISSISRNRRTRKSKTDEFKEPGLQRDSNQADTSDSEDIFSRNKTLRRSKVSSRLLQPSKDKGKNPATTATSDEHHQPVALPLGNGESDVLHTNCIKNFILGDSSGDSCIEVDKAENTEDLLAEVDKAENTEDLLAEVDKAENTEDLTVEHNTETEKHLLVCQKLMTWLNVSPEVFAQSVLMNSGNVDDSVHWLLFNKTASGDAVWDPKDDKDLWNGDEEAYKSLEESYGEMLVLKRQQFLATNSSLHV